MNFRPPKREERIKAIGSTGELSGALKRTFEANEDFKPIPKPEPGDWLHEHPEDGQTFREFTNSNINKPDKKRNTIYLQPLGNFTGKYSPSTDLLKKYTEIFFSLNVKKLAPIAPDGRVFTSRLNPDTGKKQILTADVLHFLKEMLPADAYCIMAITMEDLYPHPSWNFVFGQASLHERTGVYSFARYDPVFYGKDRGTNYGRLLLWRSFKVLTHEICHMFGIEHCIFYHCLMNGSNHLEESDARPLHLCPVDLRKLHYSTGFDPAERYKKLRSFYDNFYFKEEVQWLNKRLNRILREDE